MQDNTPKPDVSWMQVLFNAGDSPYGTLIVAAAFVLTVWTMVNLVARNRTSIVAQVFISYVPLAIGLIGSVSAFHAFVRLAAAESAPKPSDLARVMSQAIACGILGSLGTLVPGILGVIALIVHSGKPRTDGPV